jgi:hypothetical protein
MQRTPRDRWSARLVGIRASEAVSVGSSFFVKLAVDDDGQTLSGTSSATRSIGRS